MSNDDAKIIIEHFDDKFAVLLENMEVMIETKVRPIVQEELVDVKADIKTIKTAVTATNRDVQDLQQRAGRLEAIA